MTRQELKKLESKLIIYINLANAINSKNDDYSKGLRKAKEIIAEVINDEQANLWLKEAEDQRIKEIIERL